MRGARIGCVLIIDQDRVAVEELRVACRERGAATVGAENLCEGVRVLLSEVVSLIVVDAALLRLTPREHAALFERVAPGVPVVVIVRSGASIEARIGLELAGFSVTSRPVHPQDLLEEFESRGAGFPPSGPRVYTRASAEKG